MKKISRYYYLIKYTPIHQIIRRLLNPIRRRFTHLITRCIPSNEIEWNFLPIKEEKSQRFDWSEIKDNTFEFLNKKVHFEGVVVFSYPSATKLWLFQLNYFDYLQDLKVGDLKVSRSTIDKANCLMNQWIDQSKSYNNVLWSPYTVSLRLVNWIQFINTFHEKINAIHLNKIIQSIHRQYVFLKLNLEKDVKGNHLLENLIALVYASLFLKKFSLVNKYLLQLAKELKKQLHSDGMHYEKSFSYHWLMSEKIIELLETLSDFKEILIPRDISQLSQLMNLFSEKFLAFSKEYPLFNDSNYDMTQGLSAPNKPKSVVNDLSVETKYGHSNYYIQETNLGSIYMDLGSNGPTPLMAHSHNDALSFQLYQQKDPIIDDSGVAEYQPGDWRDFARSTRAHNTGMINGLEQGDFWESFRIGKRIKVSNPIKRVRINSTIYQGSYQIKSQLRKFTHTRQFHFHESFILVIDLVKGSKPVHYDGFLHFHESIQLEKMDETQYKLLGLKDSLEIKYFNIDNLINIIGSTQPIQGWKMPRFGSKIKRHVLTASSKADTNLITGFVISKSTLRLSFNGAKNLLYVNDKEIKCEVLV